MTGSNVCFIPARSGSTRLKNKNLEKISGLSLIGWATVAAKMIEVFDDIIISTDSKHYFDCVKSELINMGFSTENISIDLRSKDDAGSKVKIFDYIKSRFSHPVMVDPKGILVQFLPTSPFRQVSTIKNAIEEMVTAGTSGFSAAPYDFHVSFAFEAKDNQWTPLLGENSPMVSGQTQSQDQREFMHPCGSFYILQTKDIPKMKTIYSGAHCIPVDRLASLDIDTAQDLDYIKLFKPDPKTMLRR